MKVAQFLDEGGEPSLRLLSAETLRFPPGVNVVEVGIEEVEFLGSFVRAEIASERLGEARLRADLSINLVRRLGLVEGSRVPVALPGERIRVYRKDA